MSKFICDHCGSADLIIVQTISSGPVYYVCKTCKKETVVNQKLFDNIMDVYKKYLAEKGIKEIQEEQGKVGVYL